MKPQPTVGTGKLISPQRTQPKAGALSEKTIFSFLESSANSGKRSDFSETFVYLNLFSVSSVVNFENVDKQEGRG
jgi:hypothetical protein